MKMPTVLEVVGPSGMLSSTQESVERDEPVMERTGLQPATDVGLVWPQKDLVGIRHRLRGRVRRRRDHDRCPDAEHLLVELRDFLNRGAL